MPKKVKGTYNKAKYYQKVPGKTKTVRASTTAVTHQLPKTMKPSNFWKVPQPDDQIYIQYLSILNGAMYEDIINIIEHPQSGEKMVSTPFKKKFSYSFRSIIKQGTIKEYKLQMYYNESCTL